MADSPIRDGGDQPLDDEKPLRTAAETGVTSPAASRGATSSVARPSAISSPTSTAHGETGRAPLPGEDAAGPLDGDDAPGNAGHQPPVPTGGEPGVPDPNMEYSGDADFVAEATGERYTRSVQEGLDRIDEHKARIAELEAERASAAGASGAPLEPGPGAPEPPIGSGTPDAPARPDTPGATATPGGATGPDVPQGPGLLRPPSGGADPSGLDDPYDGGVPR